MRGIAASRAQQARAQLAAVDAYAATIAAAMGRVLALASPSAPDVRTRPDGGEDRARLAIVLFGAEQGFAGAFTERVLDAAGPDLASAELFMIGTRGASVIAERNIAAGWQAAMPSHSAGVPKLAERIAGALYTRISTGEIDRLDAVFSVWQPGAGASVTRRRLFPFDPGAFPRPLGVGVPLLNLEPAALVRELTSDYVHALLCKAALHAFEAENEARMEAMAAARKQVEHQLTSLEARQRLVRQEEITAEVIELAAGETASLGAS